MQPQTVSVWLCKAAQNDMGTPSGHAEWRENDWQTKSEDGKQKLQVHGTESFQSNMPLEITVANHDPIIPYVLSNPGAAEVDRLQLDSPVLHTLKTGQVVIMLPLVS